MAIKTPDFLFKIIIIGDPAAGKSSLMHKYIENQFRHQYSVTVGVEFASKKVKISPDLEIGLQIWDTAGQETFRSIIKSFYRNAAAAFLVYDMTNSDSLTNLQTWLNEVKENANSDVVLVLVGAKKDLEDRRMISYDSAKKFMIENKCALFFETSAKTGENVDEAFTQTAKLIFLSQVGTIGSSNEDIKELKRNYGNSNKYCCS